MKLEDLRNWKQEWKNVKHITVWGYGKNFKLHFNEIKKNYVIDAIIDNDRLKAGTWNEAHIPIKLPDDVDFKNKKIVITTHYEEISQQLEDIGMKEFIDFCDIRLLVSASAWFRNSKILLSEVHIAVTTGCTLNCKFCNMYIPFHKKQVENLSIDKFMEQIQLLFNYVDKVINLVLIGGETLLYDDLEVAIKYIKRYFSENVGNIEIVTNGTVFPKETLLKVLEKENILVSMSNYQLDDEYNNRFNKIRRMFTDNGIKVYLNQDFIWKDFSFPYEKLHLSDDLAYKNMDLCNPIFRGFNDSKLYFCHLVWSANKAGLFKERNTDYIDFSKLKDEDREKIVLLNICCHDNEYVSLCKECGGCSSMNQKLIPVGQQVM